MYSENELKEIAIISIQNYLNNSKYTKEYVEKNFTIAIKIIINNLKANDEVCGGISNVSSISQGNMSISFNTNIKNIVITEDVKTVLPRPINFMAW